MDEARLAHQMVAHIAEDGSELVVRVGTGESNALHAQVDGHDLAQPSFNSISFIWLGLRDGAENAAVRR